MNVASQPGHASTSSSSCHCAVARSRTALMAPLSLSEWAHSLQSAQQQRRSGRRRSAHLNFSPVIFAMLSRISSACADGGA